MIVKLSLIFLLVQTSNLFRIFVSNESFGYRVPAVGRQHFRFSSDIHILDTKIQKCMDKLSTWISILIFIIIPLLSQFLNKKRIVEEKKENSKKNPTELYPETDDDWYEDHAHTVVSNKKVVKDDYSEIKKQTEENHIEKKKIKTMNKNIDSEAVR